MSQGLPRHIYMGLADGYRKLYYDALDDVEQLRGEVKRLETALAGETQMVIAELEANLDCTCGFSESCRECETGKYS